MVALRSAISPIVIVMNRESSLLAVVAIAVLAISACGGSTASQPPEVEPMTTTGDVSIATITSVTSNTTIAGPAPLRVEATLAVVSHLAGTAPAGVTAEQIDCVAAAMVYAVDEDRLPDVLVAYAEPSEAVLPETVFSASERTAIVDTAAVCLPWTQILLDSLRDLPDVPPAVIDCALAVEPDPETNRQAVQIALFGEDIGLALDLLLPAECLTQAGVPQAKTAAGRMTTAQLVAAGISLESAECVGGQVDVMKDNPPDESDSEAMAAAAFAECLTPEEMELLSSLGDPTG